MVIGTTISLLKEWQNRDVKWTPSPVGECVADLGTRHVTGRLPCPPTMIFLHEIPAIAMTIAVFILQPKSCDPLFVFRGFPWFCVEVPDNEFIE
ncbi:hypothetical protein RB195_001869 [Necator americanus]|uniref:Uncharacterized protein n=1 Tax=Necator americanus TaxID=51031 RepID=A0ABR1DJ66_NECAM